MNDNVQKVIKISDNFTLSSLRVLKMSIKCNGDKIVNKINVFFKGYDLFLVYHVRGANFDLVTLVGLILEH